MFRLSEIMNFSPDELANLDPAELDYYSGVIQQGTNQQIPNLLSHQSSGMQYSKAPDMSMFSHQMPQHGLLGPIAQKAPAPGAPMHLANPNLQSLLGG